MKKFLLTAFAFAVTTFNPSPSSAQQIMGECARPDSALAKLPEYEFCRSELASRLGNFEIGVRKMRFYEVVAEINRQMANYKVTGDTFALQRARVATEIYKTDHPILFRAERAVGTLTDPEKVRPGAKTSVR